MTKTKIIEMFKQALAKLRDLDPEHLPAVQQAERAFCEMLSPCTSKPARKLRLKTSQCLGC